MDKYGEPNWKNNDHIGSMWKTRYDLALKTSTDPNVLGELAYDKQWQVRETAIVNPKIASHVLVELASHSSWQIRELVAKNPATPEYIIRNLMEDPAPAVRQTATYRNSNRSSAATVAANPNPNRRPERSMADEIETYTDTAHGIFYLPELLRWVVGIFIR